MSLVLPTYKICSACKEYKAANAFNSSTDIYVGKKDTYTYTKLSSKCKLCMASYLKEYRARHQKPKKIKPEKILNDQKDIAMMQRAPSWALQKSGIEPTQHKTYPTCDEGHRYVGKQCLPCKYGVIANSMA